MLVPGAPVTGIIAAYPVLVSELFEIVGAVVSLAFGLQYLKDVVI